LAELFAARFLAEPEQALKPEYILLRAEPNGHVRDRDFARKLAPAATVGFASTDSPSISLATPLLRKTSQPCARHNGLPSR
jgi:hypothetical protein